MNAKFKTVIIDDIINAGIDATTEQHLLDLFEYTMKDLSATLVREATLNTSDYRTAKQRGCDDYTLTMKRNRIGKVDGWVGIFTKGDAELQVTGHLE